MGKTHPDDLNEHICFSVNHRVLKVLQPPSPAIRWPELGLSVLYIQGNMLQSLLVQAYQRSDLKLASLRHSGDM